MYKVANKITLKLHYRLSETFLIKKKKKKKKTSQQDNSILCINEYITKAT